MHLGKKTNTNQQHATNHWCEHEDIELRPDTRMQEQQHAAGMHGGQDPQGQRHAPGQQQDGLLQQQEEENSLPEIGLSQQLELQTLLSLLAERRLKPEDFEARAVPILDKEHIVGMLDVSKIFYYYGHQEVQPSEAMQQALERQAMYSMRCFDPHAIADTIWGCAMMKWQPGPDLLDGMEDRACELADDFDPQEISSTLWAHATLGTPPGHEMMRLLEMRAVSRAEDFEAKDVTNLLWAYASLSWRPGEVLMEKLEMAKSDAQPAEGDKATSPRASHGEVIILPVPPRPSHLSLLPLSHPRSYTLSCPCFYLFSACGGIHAKISPQSHPAFLCELSSVSVSPSLSLCSHALHPHCQ